MIKKPKFSKGDYPGGDSCTLLRGYSYSLQEIYAARDAGQILCLRMETNDRCNLKCVYCYSYLRRKNLKEMPLKDACDAVDQAVKLGLRSVVDLGGGEPLLYKSFWPFIKHISNHKVTTVIFTNSMLINAKVAKRLFDLGVSVMAKLDGKEETQDQLTGPGTYKKIRAGLDHLINAGFTKLDGRYTRLGIAPCATKLNLSEIPEIWRFARKNNIYPNIECATKIGNATSDITLNYDEVYWLRKTLEEIDKKEFNIEWATPYSAIPAHSCGIFLSGVAIKRDGGIALCPEMPSVANLSNKTLAEVIKQPPFSGARNIESKIDEPCASCKFFRLCLGGCRSKALIAKNSIFACDPYCTLLADKQKQKIK
jgi:radical SAM protein with 4Fe4S-binding SPASM domain